MTVIRIICSDSCKTDKSSRFLTRQDTASRGLTERSELVITFAPNYKFMLSLDVLAFFFPVGKTFDKLLPNNWHVSVLLLRPFFRSRPWPSGLETETWTKWTRVHSSLETMVSRSHHWLHQFQLVTEHSLKGATTYGNRATGVGTKHAVLRPRTKPGSSGFETETWTKWTRVLRPWSRDHSTGMCELLLLVWIETRRFATANRTRVSDQRSCMSTCQALWGHKKLAAHEPPRGCGLERDRSVLHSLIGPTCKAWLPCVQWLNWGGLWRLTPLCSHLSPLQ